MSDMISYSSSFGRLEVHLCFKTKYCHDVFCSDDVQERCKEIFFNVSERYNFGIREIGFDKNHVHLIVMLKPSMSVSEAAKLLKGTSGYFLLREFPFLKERYFWGSGLWSPMIFFDSIGQEPEAIERYVRNQGC